MSTWKRFGKYESRINLLWGIFFVVAAAISIYYVARAESGEPLAGIITGAWIIVPPVLFWAEWYYLIDHTIKGNSEYGKNGIDVKRNAWTGVSILLALLFTR